MGWNDLIDLKVGSYTIIEELGRGISARVYRAYDEKNCRHVAFKALPIDFENRSSFMRRFEREVTIIQKLDHPNIVEVYDTGELDDYVYFVSRLIKGETLRQRLVRGRLTTQTASQYMIQIAQALSHAHLQGVIHRDIKPSNMLLDSERQDHILLTGFGTATIVGSQRLTSTGSVTGTPEYMSPEHAENHEVDHRTDIYSLGCVLYEALAGHPPFVGDVSVTVLYQQVHSQPTYIRSFNSEVPRELWNVLRTCLAKRPEERYFSAEQLCEALQPFADGMIQQPPSHWPPTPNNPAPTPLPETQPAFEPRQPNPTVRRPQNSGSIRQAPAESSTVATTSDAEPNSAQDRPRHLPKERLPIDLGAISMPGARQREALKHVQTSLPNAESAAVQQIEAKPDAQIEPIADVDTSPGDLSEIEPDVAQEATEAQVEKTQTEVATEAQAEKPQTEVATEAQAEKTQTAPVSDAEVTSDVAQKVATDIELETTPEIIQKPATEIVANSARKSEVEATPIIAPKPILVAEPIVEASTEPKIMPAAMPITNQTLMQQTASVVSPDITPPFTPAMVGQPMVTPWVEPQIESHIEPKDDPLDDPNDALPKTDLYPVTPPWPINPPEDSLRFAMRNPAPTTPHPMRHESPSYLSAFMSHAHANNDLCDPYHRALKLRGITCYYDRATPQTGGVLYRKLEMELMQSQALIVMVTPNAIQSPWVGREIGFFLTLMDLEPTRKLIPIYLGKISVPTMLNSYWGIQAAGRDINDVVDELVIALSANSRDELHHVRVVDKQRGKGDHTSIVEAIAAARPGERILIRKGIYRGELIIDKPLELIGDGQLGDVEILASGTSVVRFSASKGILANLTLRQTGRGKGHGVDIAAGRLELKGCDISSQGQACVAIHNNAQPTLRNNRIHDSGQSGILVFNGARGLIEKNNIYANAYAGIAIRAFAQPTILNNHIQANNAQAIRVYDHGGGVFAQNDLRRNRKGSWRIDESSARNVTRVENSE